MALTDENSGGFVATMPMAPAYGGGYGGGFGGFGGDWGWIILLLLCGWGGMGMGGFGGFAGGLGYDFPWLLNGQNMINANTNAGFDHAATQAAIGDLSTAVTTGFGNVATQLCGGFAGVNATVNGAQNAISQQLYSNEIASLNRSFAEQTANTAGFNGVQSSLCDIRYGNANNTRDILTALTAGVQSIKDQLCSDKIEAKNDLIAQLRSELMFARGQASQDVQTAAIQAGQRALANEVEQYVNPTPRPAYIVANPNCCTQSTCGCGGF